VYRSCTVCCRAGERSCTVAATASSSWRATREGYYGAHTWIGQRQLGCGVVRAAIPTRIMVHERDARGRRREVPQPAGSTASLRVERQPALIIAGKASSRSEPAGRLTFALLSGTPFTVPGMVDLPQQLVARLGSDDATALIGAVGCDWPRAARRLHR